MHHDTQWLPVLRMIDSPVVPGLVQLDVPSSCDVELHHPSGLLTLRQGERGLPVCCQIVEYQPQDEITTLALSPLGMLESAQDEGADGDDYLVSGTRTPISLTRCHRLRSICENGNHVRMELSTADWESTLAAAFVECGTKASCCNAQTSAQQWPGCCRRIEPREAVACARFADVIRLRSRTRVSLSIDLVVVLQTTVVLIGHERQVVDLLKPTSPTTGTTHP